MINKAMFGGLFSVIAVIAFINTAFAAPHNGDEYWLSQPDGAKVRVLVWGDEFYQDVECPDGYTLIRGSDGWIVYAELSADSSEYIPTITRYTDRSRAPGTRRGLRINAASVREKQRRSREALGYDEMIRQGPRTRIRPSPSVHSYGIAPAPPEPERVVGLLLLVDFPDERAKITQTMAEEFCNKPGGEGGINPDGSVYDYFRDVSNGLLEYTNIVTPIITLDNNKSYYDIDQPIGSGARELITHALNKLNDMNFDLSEVTTQVSGGRNVTVALNIFYAGYPERGWSRGLWPHMSSYGGGATVNGISFSRYQMTNLGDAGVTSKMDVFLHETGHLVMGWPDLYNYETGSNAPHVGPWCIMSMNYMIQPNPYFRYLAGWITTTDITAAEIGTVFSHEANSPAAYVYRRNENESYFIEARMSTGVRNRRIPASGLAVWHLHKSGDNRYPTTRFPLLALMKADGGGLIHWGSPADLFRTDVNTNFNGVTVPAAIYHDGIVSGINITEISDAGEVMTFKIGCNTLYQQIAAYATAAENTVVELNQDFTLTSIANIPSPSAAGRTLTIRSANAAAPVTLTRGVNGNLFTVSYGAALILENIIISGGSDNLNNDNSLVTINYGGALIMKSGAVLRNDNANSGLGVRIADGGDFTMIDGVVFGIGTNTGDVVSGSYNPGGAVIAWNKPASAEPFVYDEYTYDDLTVSPAQNAIAEWMIKSGKAGISYENGSNSGFIEVSGVTLETKAVTTARVFYKRTAEYAAAAEDAVIEIGQDLTLNSLVNIPGPAKTGSTLTIRSADPAGPVTLTRDINGNLFTLSNSASLVLENIIIDGDYDKRGNCGGSLIRVNSGGTLTMNNGAAVRNNATNAHGGGVYVNGGTLTMNGGKISGNNALSNGVNVGGRGGGIYMSGGTFTMNSGEISGNNAISEWVGNNVYPSMGGGVYIQSGTFTINNGKINRNDAYSDGGVYVLSSSAFTMNGGEISSHTNLGVYMQNNIFYMNGGIVVGASATGANAVYGTHNLNGGNNQAPNNGIIISWNKPSGADPLIYVKDTDTRLTAHPAVNAAAVWAIENNKFGISYKNGANIGFIEIDGVTVVTQKEIDDAAITAAQNAIENMVLSPVPQTTLNTQSAAKSYIEDIINTLILNGVNAAVTNEKFTAAAAGTSENINGTDGSYTFTVKLNKGIGIELLTDELTLVITATPVVTTTGEFYAQIAYYATATSDIIIEVDQDIIMNSLVNILTPSASNKTLTIRSTTPNAPVTLTRGVSGNLFTVPAGVTLILEDVIIDGDHTGSFTTGGGSLFRVNGGALIMNSGAVIQNNRNTGSGGGVSVSSSGTFTMNGGKISSNPTGTAGVANSGGGVNISGGAFTMTGGEISGNTISSNGGGVFVSNGTFNMSGGTISGNSAGTAGYVSGGGSVSVSSGGIFNMSGGKINGNTGIGSSAAGGVLISAGGECTMTGGEISGNTAANGSGVRAAAGGTFNLYGGAVTGTGTIIFGSYSFNTGPSPAPNNAAAVVWNRPAGAEPFVYTKSTNTHLTAHPAEEASAVWEIVSGRFGISYENGANKGFVEVAGVTVQTKPTITWPTASTITYGATLSASTLTGGSTEYGSFAWTNNSTIPTVVNNGYQVTFTPSAEAMANHSIEASLTNTVQVTVTPKTLTVEMLSVIPAAIINSTAQIPILTVTDNDLGELTINVDYLADLTPQTEAGTYPITVKGIGNYTGTPSIDFVVKSAPVAVLPPDRIIPNPEQPKSEASAPVTILAGELTAGPNPAAKQSGVVNFFWQGKRAQSTVFTVFDASGNVVNKIRIKDNKDTDEANERRIVGIWDLTDRKGRAVGAGTYLVRGFITTPDGRERVSVMVGVK